MRPLGGFSTDSHVVRISQRGDAKVDERTLTWLRTITALGSNSREDRARARLLLASDYNDELRDSKKVLRSIYLF